MAGGPKLNRLAEAFESGSPKLLVFSGPLMGLKVRMLKVFSGFVGGFNQLLVPFWGMKTTNLPRCCMV